MERPADKEASCYNPTVTRVRTQQMPQGDRWAKQMEAEGEDLGRIGALAQLRTRECASLGLKGVAVLDQEAQCLDRG